tara:strand:+ start:326 stop:796 length:471 start_codon:yes stop_codon:yes gene_type:complete
MQAHTARTRFGRRHPDLAEHHDLEGRVGNLGTVDPNAYSMALSQYLTPAQRHAVMQSLMDPTKNLGYESKFDSLSPINLTGKPNYRSTAYAEDPSIPRTDLVGGFEGPKISRMSRPEERGFALSQPPSSSPQASIDRFYYDNARQPTDEELMALLG